MAYTENACNLNTINYHIKKIYEDNELDEDATIRNFRIVQKEGTREKYRHKGIGTAMMHCVMLKCKELGVEKCYVNSYDWRRKFYNASGFTTEDTIGFYHKKI